MSCDCRRRIRTNAERANVNATLLQSTSMCAMHLRVGLHFAILLRVRKSQPASRALAYLKSSRLSPKMCNTYNRLNSLETWLSLVC